MSANTNALESVFHQVSSVEQVKRATEIPDRVVPIAGHQ
jgi:hypothetical protein